MNATTNSNISTLLVLVVAAQEEPTSANRFAIRMATSCLTLDEALTLLPEAKKGADNCPNANRITRTPSPEAELAERIAYRCVTCLASAIANGLDPVFPTGMALSTVRQALATGRDGFPELQVGWSVEDRRILNNIASAVRANAQFAYTNFLNLTEDEVKDNTNTVFARALLGDWYGCFR
jgi:hypothetical protein